MSTEIKVKVTVSGPIASGKSAVLEQIARLLNSDERIEVSYASREVEVEATTEEEYQYYPKEAIRVVLDEQLEPRHVDKVKKNNLILMFERYLDIIGGLVHEDTSGQYTDLPHLVWLCREAIERYDEYHLLDADNSKVNRWLGYVQGILVSRGVITVEEERNHSRPLLTAHRKLK